MDQRHETSHHVEHKCVPIPDYRRFDKAESGCDVGWPYLVRDKEVRPKDHVLGSDPARQPQRRRRSVVENEEQRADLAQEEEEDCRDVAHRELCLVASVIFDETVKVGVV